jgi:hypothetical protein
MVTNPERSTVPLNLIAMYFWHLVHREEKRLHSLLFVNMRLRRNRVDHAVDNTRVDRMGDVEGKQSDAPLDQFECIRMVSFKS